MYVCCCFQDDAADAKWFSVLDLPPLAFDHKMVVRQALLRLAGLQATQATGKQSAAWSELREVGLALRIGTSRTR